MFSCGFINDTVFEVTYMYVYVFVDTGISNNVFYIYFLDDIDFSGTVIISFMFSFYDESREWDITSPAPLSHLSSLR